MNKSTLMMLKKLVFVFLMVCMAAGWAGQIEQKLFIRLECVTKQANGLTVCEGELENRYGTTLSVGRFSLRGALNQIVFTNPDDGNSAMRRVYSHDVVRPPPPSLDRMAPLKPGESVRFQVPAFFLFDLGGRKVSRLDYRVSGTTVFVDARGKSFKVPLYGMGTTEFKTGEIPSSLRLDPLGPAGSVRLHTGGSPVPPYGIRATFDIDERRYAELPPWEPDFDDVPPPVDAVQAAHVARRALSGRCLRENLTLEEVRLVKKIKWGTPIWYYVVRFMIGKGPGSVEQDVEVDVVVLMDGRTVLPSPLTEDGR